ncbi:MAG: zinc ribbon domain-containing protein [Candidatus Hermodarchaeota archaeon]
MLQDLFPFDIFGFISGFFVLVFVIAIIFFIIVILIVYKLLHSNVDNVKKKPVKVKNILVENHTKTGNETEKEELKTVVVSSICKYCGENIENNTTFCPYCGSNLIV